MDTQCIKNWRGACLEKSESNTNKNDNSKNDINKENDISVLNDRWIFWFHDPLDNNWKIESYKNILEIKSINDFWCLYNNLDKKIVSNSMLFLMRKDVEPLWEHQRNVNGGCWSLKISKENIHRIWENISIALLGENIGDNINGISISPKKNFCIIKIWNDNKNNSDISLLKKIDNVSFEGIIYKPHN